MRNFKVGGDETLCEEETGMSNWHEAAVRSALWSASYQWFIELNPTEIKSWLGHTAKMQMKPY